MKLTEKTIDAATFENGEWLWDEALPGFGVRVQQSGRKTFIIRYRNSAGRSRSYTIARCCDLSAREARDKARSLFARIREGYDPAEAKDDAKNAPTVADLADRYMRDHAWPYKKPRSARNDESMWRLHVLPAIGRRTVAEIRKEDVQRIHTAMRGNPVHANRMLALVSKAWSLAMEWEWADRNVAKGVSRYHEARRGTILTPEQVANVNKLLELEAAPFALLVRLLLLTGCRVSEIRDARVEWVDFHRGLLLLPDSKTGQREIALPRAALRLLEARRGHEWIIEGRFPGTHMEHVWGTWKRFRKEAGIPGVRLHDLRHTVGSMGHKAGLSLREIAELLGHRQLSTAERYLHGFAGDQTTAADRVAAVIGL
jgi:integrase